MAKKLKKPLTFHKVKDSVSVRSQPCGYKYEQGWTITSYLPQSGKTVGMWVCNNNPSWGEYYNKYGFTFITVGADLYSFNYAKNTIGFGDNTMVQISSYSNVDAIVNTFNSKYYYIDEPLENDWTTLQVIQVGATINAVRPGAKLIISSCKWPTMPYNVLDSYGTKYNLILSNSSNIFITVDKYVPEFYWYWPPFDFIPEDYWDKFQEWYGSRFIGGWMHVLSNYQVSGNGESFSDMLSNGSNLGINLAFLYGLDNPDLIPLDIERFCFAAWNCGWLRGMAENTIIVWRCDLPNPCNCDPDDPDDPWYVEQVIYSGVNYEVFP